MIILEKNTKNINFSLMIENPKIWLLKWKNIINLRLNIY